MSIAPCKNCTLRYVGCHANCSEYLEWAELARSVREAQRHDEHMRNVVNELLGRPAESPRGSR